MCKYVKGLGVILSLILILFFGVTYYVYAEQPSFDLNAESAILMEVETGEIIFEKNSHQELPPASMTKIMTMLLAMESIANGQANLEDKLVVSERASSMGGSQVYLEPGEEMTLEDLMKAIAISSANDACVAVAEYLYGTEEEFIKRMNERAGELGLKNTYYYNTNGLPSGDPEVQGNYTSAYDLAILTRELLKYPRIFDWTSTWIDYLREGKFVLNNTNRLVRHYKGADGLKTGFTEEAKYCVTSTAKRNGLRFIAVVMAVDDSTTRFNEAAQLLSYGFNIYNGVLIAKKDEVVQEIIIRDGKEELARGLAKDELIVPVKKGEEDKISKVVELRDKLQAPLKKGEEIGEIKIFKGNLLLKKGDLIIDRDVEKASIFQLIYRIIKRLILSLVNIFR